MYYVLRYSHFLRVWVYVCNVLSWGFTPLSPHFIPPIHTDFCHDGCGCIIDRHCTSGRFNSCLILYVGCDDRFYYLHLHFAAAAILLRDVISPQHVQHIACE